MRLPSKLYRFRRWIRHITPQLILILIPIVLIPYHIRTVQQYENQLMASTYVKNYHMWYGIFKTTLYTTHPSECSKTKDHRFFGITKSGTRAVPFRTVAVDPKVVSLGSILIDPDTGQTFIAEDTGNKVLGYAVDIFIGEGTDDKRQITDDWGCQNRLFIVIEPRNEGRTIWQKIRKILIRKDTYSNEVSTSSRHS